MSRLLLLSLNNDPTEEFGSKHIGGQAKYVLEISKQLLFFGWEVDIYTIGSKNKEFHQELVKYLNVFRFFREKEKEYDYDISITEIKNITYDILQYIQKESSNYNMILACYWISGIAAVELKDNLQLPIVISFSSLGQYKKIIDNSQFIEDRISYEKHITNHADRIIASSETEKLDLIKYYDASESKIQVIPRGIDPRIFHP